MQKIKIFWLCSLHANTASLTPGTFLVSHPLNIFGRKIILPPPLEEEMFE